MLKGAALYFFIFVFIFLSQSGAQENDKVCANGASPANQDLIMSFNENQDPLKMAFVKSKKATDEHPLLSSTTYSQCENTSPTRKPFGLFAQLAKLSYQNVAGNPDEEMPIELLPKPLRIKKECIETSLKRRAGRGEYVCRSNPRRVYRAGIAGGKTAQCFNDEMVDYMSFALNQAIDCLSGNDPIDSRNIFKKFNAETGFNFTVSWRGGRGLSQITTPAAKELSTPIGNGRYILQDVIKSTKPSCEPFKHIAASDLARPPRINNGSLCDWVSPGDGLARNLLYGIGYHVHMRDSQVIPALRRISPTLAAANTVVDLLTTMSFGREGIKGVKGLLRQYRISKNTPPSQLEDIIEKESQYVNETTNKQKELLCLKNGIPLFGKQSCQTTNFTEEEIAGDLCVTEP